MVVAVFDIDDFKIFNDQLGHPAGDECLRMIGRHLRGQIDPEREVVARWAGEEFAVVWRNIAPQTARARAGRLRQSIGELSLDMPGVVCSQPQPARPRCGSRRMPARRSRG